MEQKTLLNSAPRILCLLDKNPVSSSFGSFDRKYWQYKIIDFPCGMQQELVRPLAYLWQQEFENNIYCQKPRIAEYIRGAFTFHERCCHRDGSMDDYFPYERAFGATAYALAATTDAAIMTGLCPESSIASLEKSGNFLAEYREAGLLSNHLAIAALALINLYEITGKEYWKNKAEDLLSLLVKLFNPEGWFPEYGGCDLGYQTVTVEFLSRYYQKAPSEDLLDLLKKSCRFLSEFTHPDGSLGGEYGSRNTYNFYPGGFAILSSLIPEAAKIYSMFRLGIEEQACNYLEDDGVFGHILSSYVTVLAAGDVAPIKREGYQDGNEEKIFFHKEAGLYSVKSGRYVLVGNTTKGGVFKVFKDGKLLTSDTGYVGKLEDGTVFCQNNGNSSSGYMENNLIEIRGQFKKYSNKRLDMIQMMGLRFLSLLFGRFSKYSNVIRYIMQMLLIYKRRDVGISFKRKISFNGEGVTVEDIILPSKKIRIREIFSSTDCLNMHVITSDSYQIANLLSWEKMSIGDGFEPGGELQFRKRY